MQVRHNQGQSGSLPGLTQSTQAQVPIKEDLTEKELKEKTRESKPDSSHLDSKNGKAMPTMNLISEAQPDKPKAESPPHLENPVRDKDKCEATPDDESKNNFQITTVQPKPSTLKPFKLTAIDIGGSILNDSNMFVKDEDDLGMTTSYTAYANLSFLNKNGSQTNVFLNNRSALHTQFLSKENQLTHQSLLTTHEFEAGIRNNAWLFQNPHFSTGAKLQFKGIDTNPASGWANVQAGLHDFGHLRQYQNHENPFVGDEAYLTPMVTLDFEDEAITGKLYLKTEAKTAFGAMIPLQQNRDFYTPLRADAYSSIKFGYAYREHPLIYLKMDGSISNDPLPYNRDHGTLGAVGLAIGNEFSLMKRKNMDVNLFLETKVLQPYGHLPNNPLPDQPGKHDLIHEMFNLKLQFLLK